MQIKNKTIAKTILLLCFPLVILEGFIRECVRMYQNAWFRNQFKSDVRMWRSWWRANS